MTHGTGGRTAIALRSLLTIFAAMAAFSPALAASIPLSWNPVSHPDLAGYRIYYGTSTGVYFASVDAGNRTEYVLDGLTDCTHYCIAVKSYTTAGVESEEYSDELIGMPTPVVTSIEPSSAEQGASAALIVRGANFAAGANALFPDPGITVGPSTRLSCTQLSATASVALTAATGAKRVEVRNGDLSRGGANAVFSVLPLRNLIVVSVTPLAGATNVAPSTRPMITFSARVNATTVTPLTVRLLDSAGSPIVQAPGSPSLDAAGLVATITPLSSLPRSTTFRVSVVGGTLGVFDLQGHPLAAGYTQAPGFTTSAADPLPLVVSTNPPDGATAVPILVQPAVSFNTRMDPGSLTPETVRLVGPNGVLVPQAPGSPELDATGMIATISPLDTLSGTTAYRLRVMGGPAGVRDEQNQAMTSDYQQLRGFTTEMAGSPIALIGDSPSNGAQDVPVTVDPQVSFDRPVDPQSVTPLTVRLLNSSNQPVPQASGSPAVDATGRVATIVPLGALSDGQAYRIEVRGGAGGVTGLDGQPMEADYRQEIGFTAAAAGTASRTDSAFWYDDVDEFPTIEFLSSMDAPVGAYVALYGDDFGTRKGRVRFGTKDAPIVSWTDRKIVAVVPGGGLGPILVRTSANVESEPFPFTLVAGAVRHLDVTESARGDGSAGHPWNSFADANAAVRPGDFVVVHGGVYSGALSQEAVFKATTSGLPGRSITYFAEPGAVVYLDGFSVGKQAIRASGAYVGFVGFVAAGGKFQGVLLEGAGTRAIDLEVKEGVSLAAKGQGININGEGAQALGNHVHDNHDDGIYAYATDMVIGRNTIAGSGHGASDARGFGIQLHHAMPGPTFFDARVLRNYITGSLRSGISVDLYSVGADLLENVIGGNREHCVVIGGNAQSTSFRNNTCDRNSVSTPPPGSYSEIALEGGRGASQIVVYNNVINGASPVEKAGVFGGGLYLDYNLYGDMASGWTWDGLTYTDVEGWRDATRKDLVSQVEDPLFSDVSHNDYRPRVGSPMIDRGFTIGCARAPWGMGCDIGAFEYRDDEPVSLPPLPEEP